jgi:cell division septal protein FtsQ
MTPRRPGRRSQKRLGTQYHSSTRPIRFALAPVIGPWQVYGSRLAAALLLAALGWAAYAVFTSSSFYVYGAEVQGNAVVTPEEVYAASQLDGMSVFWVNADATAKKVEALPNVKSARVEVRLPAYVTITIEERTPELMWQTGSARWWIDAEGTVVPPRGDMSSPLTIIDMDAQPASAGQHLDPSILAAARSLRRLLPELPEMQYSRATGISFTTREGWPVRLGDGQNMDAKLTILVALRKDLLAQKVSPEFIDVRFVERPFYKVARSQKPEANSQ